MLPMMLPVWDLRIARQRPLEARVSIAIVKTFPEARCSRLPLRTTMAKVPDSNPIVPPRMWRIKSGSRILPHPFSTHGCDSGIKTVYVACRGQVPGLARRFRAEPSSLPSISHGENVILDTKFPDDRQSGSNSAAQADDSGFPSKWSAPAGVASRPGLSFVP